jgi:hypothetical protein
MFFRYSFQHHLTRILGEFNELHEFFRHNPKYFGLSL